MSEEIITEIDEMLADTLPDDPDELSHTVDDERKQEMIQLLKHAEEELGRSPSLRAFNSLDFETSGYTIENAFGTWNDAKREAGLELYEAGEGRYPSTPINSEYFETIDSPETAYWLGALIGTSSIKPEPNLTLRLSRTGNERYFIDEFSEEVDSEYSISTTESQGRQETKQTQLLISNPTFIENLLGAGYPHPDEDAWDYPTLDAVLRPSFVRGFLESSGYFSSGWQIMVDRKNRAKTLQAWFEEFGAKRPTLGNNVGKIAVRISNVFDVRAVFETCWPAGIETTPSFTPYPRKIVNYLESEYPYPENVEYLSE